MVSAREIRNILDDNPDLEPALQELLETEEPFEFQDIDLDSGQFGEIGSKELVTEATDKPGYRLSDRRAIEKALKGDISEPQKEAEGETQRITSNIDWRAGAFLSAALLFIAVMRSAFSFNNVYLNGDIVFSGNDPYAYRYLVEELLRNPDATLAALPEGIASGEPLYVSTMWFVSLFLGGSKTAVGWVMAWYPVILAIVTGVLLYYFALQVTDDRRIALSSLLFLAILPGHAMRTSLGFPDHHAFDYPWLVLSALSLLAILQSNLRSKRGILGVLGLGVGVSAQVFAWEAGPLLIIPIGIVVLILGLLWLHDGKSPAENGFPLLIGLGFGSILTWVIHTTLSWHSTVVAMTPGLLFIGSLVVLGVAEGAHRLELRVTAGIAAEFIAAIAGIFLISTFSPTFWNTGLSELSSKLLRTDAIAETQSLFGDSLGWLLLFGLILVVALPYMTWFTYRMKEEIKWVIPVAYAWYLFVLAMIQIRFVGEFGFIVAFFAAIVFVHMLAWTDTARQPKPFDRSIDGRKITTPNGKTLLAIAFVFLLVGGLSIVQVPLKTSQITHPPAQHEAATWMADYSDERGLEYPENRVFAKWGNVRMYNYFVNGESRSYGFARQNFQDFVSSSDGGEWHTRLNDKIKFIVTPTLEEEVPRESLYYQLHWENAQNLDGYELVYATERGTHKVFILTDRDTGT